MRKPYPSWVQDVESRTILSRGRLKKAWAKWKALDKKEIQAWRALEEEQEKYSELVKTLKAMKAEAKQSTAAGVTAGGSTSQE